MEQAGTPWDDSGLFCMIIQEISAAAVIPFGTWLLAQQGRGGFIGGLADAAAGDRSFPRTGDVEDARKWLQRRMASGDDWEALDDAELDWLSL